MKKIFALILAIAMLLTACAALAEDKPLTGKTLKIALSPNFMFFETESLTDPTGYEGLDIDIIKYLADELGFDFEIVPMPFSSLIGALQANDVDFVISGMSGTEERAKVVDFSMTYATTKVGIVSKVGSDFTSYEALKGQTVCCSAGTNYEAIIEGIPGATLKTFNGQAEVGLSVANGADGVVAGLTSINGSKKLAATVLDEAGNAMLQYAVLDGDDSTADHYNIAFPKGSELKDTVDAVLQKMMDNGDLDKMIQYWLY